MTSLAVGLQLGLLVAVHEVDVELVDAGLVQLEEPSHVLLGRSHDAEAVGHLVGHELRVVGADLGVVAIVVALALADVAGERFGQLLAGVLVDEVDDVVADQGREPAHALAALVDGPDVRRSGSLDLDLGGVTPGLCGGAAHDADHPPDEVDVGELQDDAVGRASGHAQHHRPVAGDPDGQLVSGPVQVRSSSVSM